MRSWKKHSLYANAPLLSRLGAEPSFRIKPFQVKWPFPGATLWKKPACSGLTSVKWDNRGELIIQDSAKSASHCKKMPRFHG
jgi:hypothetical protein